MSKGGGGVIREGGAYYKNLVPNGGLIREGLIERGLTKSFCSSSPLIINQ